MRARSAAADTPSYGSPGRTVDLVVLFAGGALTIVSALLFVWRPWVAAAVLGVLAVVCASVMSWRAWSRVHIEDALVVGLVSLPLLALLGPSFAVPGVPQLFAYRIVLLAVGFVGATYLIVQPRPISFAARDLALPITLWAAWAGVGLLWAPDKSAALNYLAILVTMLVVMAATAAAGGTSRRLRAFGLTMLGGYLFILGFTILEATLGVRLPTSRLFDAVSSQSYAVTSVFHNQNDLATYIALCWPFMLTAFFFTRRKLWRILSLLCIALGAIAFVRTGSRSSLVAIGFSSMAALGLFTNLGARLATRTGKLVGGLAVLFLVAAAGYLLFNDSESDMLRQFRLESLIAQAQAGSGSGAIRTSLTSRGLEIVGTTHLLGAGPGQAESIIASGVDGLGISNLHNWWLETYANGGLVGFALHFVFFVGLVAALWPVAKNAPDPFLRYLASGTVLALIGYTIGALGPSSALSFAPMWILYGLGLAVVCRARSSSVCDGNACVAVKSA